MTRKIKIVLTLSLLLNVLFLGLAAGEGYKRMNRQPWGEVADLAPETRDLLKATFREKRDEVKPAFRELRSAMSEMRKVLEAESFDAARFEDAAQKVQSLDSKLSAHRIETFKELASQLPQSERKKIAEKFMRSFMKGGFDRKGGHRFDSARAQESQGAGPEGMEPERRRNFDDVPPSSVPDDMPPMPAPQE